MPSGSAQTVEREAVYIIFRNSQFHVASLLAHLICGHQRERRLGQHRRRTRHRLDHGGRSRGRRRHRLREIQIRFEIGTQKCDFVSDYRCGGGGRGGGGGVQHGRWRRVMRRVSLGVKVRRYGERRLRRKRRRQRRRRVGGMLRGRRSRRRGRRRVRGRRRRGTEGVVGEECDVWSISRIIWDLS